MKDYLNKKTSKSMDDLIKTQKEQVDSFKAFTTKFRKEINQSLDQKVGTAKQELKEDIGRLSHMVAYNSLKSQANNNKLNLVIIGLKEESDKTPLSVAKDFFSQALGVTGVSIDVAYRLGTQSDQNSSYIRPLVVRFSGVADRDKIWKKRQDITAEEGERKIRIQADLPKRLRNDNQVLYRVCKAAASYDEFKSAKVKDYTLLLNGEIFAADQLEQLPFQIRPSTIASPRSDSLMAFFSCHSILSNHHPSTFTCEGTVFSTMEHYLAFRRAQLSGQKKLIDRALYAYDPVEAKAVLNSLKKDQPQKWEENIPDIAVKGLKAKFSQNPHMRDFLCSTQGLRLGEAYKNEVWGVGKTLSDPEVLDYTQWPEGGNLLGHTLERIRDEFLQAKK